MAAPRQRQQQQFHLDLVAGARHRSDAGHDAEVFVADDGQQILHRRHALRVPQIEESHILQFAGEQGTDLGAGEAEPAVAGEIVGEHERIGENVADCRRINVVALRRGAGAALHIPVAEQFACGRMFHWPPPCAVAGRSGRCLCPIGTDRPAEAPRDTATLNPEQGACRLPPHRGAGTDGPRLMLKPQSVWRRRPASLPSRHPHDDPCRGCHRAGTRT